VLGERDRPHLGAGPRTSSAPGCFTDIERWSEVARAHAEVFGAVRPAATMVEVSRLIAPGLLVEVEADAWVGG